jgi:SAM-dependent methyltransferase
MQTENLHSLSASRQDALDAPTDKNLLFSALRKHVGAWYEDAYGEQASHSKMIEFYASGTEARTDTVLGLLKGRYEVAPPPSVLDVGCGFGSIPVYLAWKWRCSEILATDRTDGYYACGQAAAREIGLSNVRFDTLELGALEFEEKFDLVISVNMLNYMTSRPILQDALTRLARATRKRGKLIVYTPHFWSYREPFTRIPLLHFLPVATQDRIVRRLGKRSGMLDVRNPSLGEITRTLRKHGCRCLGASPTTVYGRARATHLTAWFEKQ